MMGSYASTGAYAIWPFSKDKITGVGVGDVIGTAAVF